ncbi:hypothetical protein ACQ4PT_053935 [Festuca glaucescens]
MVSHHGALFLGAMLFADVVRMGPQIACMVLGPTTPWSAYRVTEPAWMALLEPHYDQNHRGRLMEEEKKVNWDPYGKAENFAQICQFDLNPQCTAEAHLWRMQCPLICLYAIEYHIPQQVMTQFGLFQETPLEWKDTSIDLHRLGRMQQKTITNWANHHRKYITEWWKVLRKAEKTRDDTTPRFDSAAFDHYVAWLNTNTRWEVNAPAFTQQETLELPNTGFDDIANLEYNRLIRDGRQVQLASVLRFVREELVRHNVDAMEALALPPGRRSDKALARFAKTSIARVRSLVTILGCRSMVDTMRSGLRSNLAHGESTIGRNIELEDDVDEDPTDVPKEELEAEVDDFLRRAEYEMEREADG